MLSGAAGAATPTVGRAVTAIAELMSQRTGQDVLAHRAWRIDHMLQPLLRARGDDLDRLAAAVRREPAVADQVIEALLNQETSFYRDLGVIDLAASFLTERGAAQPGHRVRAWSAGCSMGQEPYSLAMLLADAAPGVEPVALPEIVATDVSAAAIARARAGRYSQFEIQRGLPIRRMLAWFDQDGEVFVARPELTRLVTFRRHNLVTDPAPWGRFDVILCRNVLLYFPAETRGAVFARLASALKPGGMLILGAGETTIGQTELFVPSRTHRGGYMLASDCPR